MRCERIALPSELHPHSTSNSKPSLEDFNSYFHQGFTAEAQRAQRRVFVFSANRREKQKCSALTSPLTPYLSHARDPRDKQGKSPPTPLYQRGETENLEWSARWPTLHNLAVRRVPCAVYLAPCIRNGRRGGRPYTTWPRAVYLVPCPLPRA